MQNDAKKGCILWKKTGDAEMKLYYAFLNYTFYVSI